MGNSQRWANGILGRGALIVGLFALLPARAGATVLFYEGFGYTSGSTLAGQGGADNGFGGAWTQGGAANGSNTSAKIVSGLSFSDYATTGNALQIRNNAYSSGGSYPSITVTRPLSSTADVAAGSTVYTSFLYSPNQNYQFSFQNRLGVTDTPGADPGKFITQTAGLFQSDHYVGVGYNSTVTSSGSSALSSNSVYLIVTEFQNVNGAGTQTAETWVLTASGYDSIKGSTITDASLNSANYLGSPLTATATGVTLSDVGSLSLSLTSEYGIENDATYDEVKAFTTLSDIGSTTVPEPAASLAAVGGIPYLLGRRRRQQRTRS